MAGIDIEITNRCNAKCSFCPRDATPHQGLMGPEVFEQSLLRCKEVRDVSRRHDDRDPDVSLCGLGEPLLNRRAPEYVRRVREEGFRCSLSSNASLLDERRAVELLDAGLQSIFLNLGEQGEEYERVYRLPFDRTRDNVLRFRELAEGRCEVVVVLVDHRDDAEHVAQVRRYWQELGFTTFHQYELINRGGALVVDHMHFEQYPELVAAEAMLAEQEPDPLCIAPWLYLFIGYDGRYYLCCSDWRKQAPLGSVFDRSFDDLVLEKLQHVRSRHPVCRTCSYDPLNRLVATLRPGSTKSSAPVVASVLAESELARSLTRRSLGAVPPRSAAMVTARRTIPIRQAMSVPT